LMMLGLAGLVGLEAAANLDLHERRGARVFGSCRI